MIHEVKAWLPDEQPGEIEEALEAIVQRWLHEWFVTPPLCVIEAGNSEGGGYRWWGCEQIVVGAARSERVALGRAILLGQGEASHPRDSQILDSVACAALLALSEQLCGAIRADSSVLERARGSAFESMRGFRLECPQKSWAIELLLGADAPVRLRKHQAGSHGTPKLESLSSALSEMEVSLGCHLGVAALSPGDLDELAIGDLIVLDTRTEEQLRLTVRGQVAPRGKAEIGKRDEGHCLRITEAPDIKYENS